MRLITRMAFLVLIALFNFKALATEPRQVLSTEQFLSIGSIKSPIAMGAFSAQGQQQSLSAHLDNQQRLHQHSLLMEYACHHEDFHQQ